MKLLTKNNRIILLALDLLCWHSEPGSILANGNPGTEPAHGVG
jgi:hypothetical protein